MKRTLTTILSLIIISIQIFGASRTDIKTRSFDKISHKVSRDLSKLLDKDSVVLFDNFQSNSDLFNAKDFKNAFSFYVTDRRLFKIVEYQNVDKVVRNIQKEQLSLLYEDQKQKTELYRSDFILETTLKITNETITDKRIDIDIETNFKVIDTKTSQTVFTKSYPLKVYELYRIPKVALSKSLFYPGRGQFYNQDFLKGISQMGLFTGSIFGGIYGLQQSSKSYKLYKNANEQSSMDSHFNNADKLRNASFVAFGVSIATYVYSAYDAHKSATRYRSRLKISFDPLFKQEMRVAYAFNI